jgi:CRISPR-associated protein Csx10
LAGTKGLMDRLKVTITARAPLCFSERRPDGQFRETARYVPGTALRAAVAARMLSEAEVNDEMFQRLFTSERRVVFANAYPASHVLPATAMSCKAESGFSPDGHGVVDTLIGRLCFEALDPAGLLYLPKCSYCGMRMERQMDFYRLDGDSFRAERITERLLTRVAINRRRATAEDDLLYSPIVISEGWLDKDQIYHDTQFTTTLIPPVAGDLLRHYLEGVDHLGSGTSRGLGRVAIKVEQESVNDEEELKSLRERREQFNAAVQEFWTQLQKLPGCAQPPHRPDAGTYFTVNLYADTVLKDCGWLSTAVLTERMLKDCCGVDDDTLQLLRAYSGSDYRGGWNVAWGLPKDVDVVVPMGSLFVFWTQQPDRWDKPLLHLERWGLGERTAEGFGQVQVCDAFHVRARRKNPL